MVQCLTDAVAPPTPDSFHARPDRRRVRRHRRFLDRVASRRLRCVHVGQPEEGPARPGRACLVARPLLRGNEADARRARGRRPGRRVRLRQLPQPRQPPRPVQRAALRLPALDRGDQPQVLAHHPTTSRSCSTAPASEPASRGVPAAVGTDGVVVYSGDQQLDRGSGRRTSWAARSRRSTRRTGAPRSARRRSTSRRSPTATRRGAPSSRSAPRLARLSSRLHVPTLRVGQWFDDGQRVNAEAAGSVLVLEYASCGNGSDERRLRRGALDLERAVRRAR